MPVIPFLPWAPDAAGVDATVTDTLSNVLPRAKGYGPCPSLVEVSGTLPAACKGACEASIVDGAPIYFAGTATKLYRYDVVGQTWADVSGPVAYSVVTDDYWSFARFGDYLVAVHTNAPPQWINVKTGSAFATLLGTGASVGADPPICRFVDIVGDYLVLGGLVDYPGRLQWCGFNNIFEWRSGLNGSDIQEFPDGGQVQGIAGGDFGLVFQRRSIRRMVRTGDAKNPFQFQRVEEDRGAIAPWSIVKSGARVFFLDADGFYEFADGASRPIGAQICNDWFAKNVDGVAIRRTFAIRDITGPRVMWAFKSATDGRGILDQTIIYDWLLQRWVPTTLAAEVWLRAATLAKSLDTLTTGSIDDLTVSTDSAYWIGGVPRLGAITPSHKLAFRSGLPLAATLETQDAMLARPNRAFIRGARLDSDASAFTIAIGGREDLSKPIGWGAARAREVTGFAPARSSARYHRGRVTIPMGDPWTYATGLEPDASSEGLR